MSGPVIFDVITERSGRILLDRKETGNKVNVEMMRGFIASLREAHEAAIDVLIVGANGEDFSVGRDQEEKPSGLSKRDNLALIIEANELLTEFSGVTIAEVRGRALGFGSGVAAQCDITIASDNAVLGFTEIRHGFAPAIVMTYLETFVNRKVATDLLMTGRTIPASEAHAMGLVTRVVPDDELEDTIDELVDQLLEAPAEALRQCKFFLREIGEFSPADRGTRALDALTDRR